MSYFTEQELECKHCGEYYFNSEFLQVLNNIREECDFPFFISSAYRCPDHPIEATKKASGTHCLGLAVDIKVSGKQALRVIEVAQQHGVKRIGVSQKGDFSKRFIHLDFGQEHNFPYPAIWSY